MGELVRTLLPLTLALTVAAAPGSPDSVIPAPAPATPAPNLAPADTTVPAHPGDRLTVQNLSGRVLVEVGEDSEVRLLSTGGRRERLGLARQGSRISVEPSDRRGGDQRMDAVLRVPRWMEVSVRGRDLDVEIRGLEGRVEVRNVEGDVRLAGTRGSVLAHTVDGAITARNTRGDLSLRSQGDDVRVEDAVATIVEVRSGDGDVMLRGVDALQVQAETLDGDAVLELAVHREGQYHLSVHDGDASVFIPRDAGVQVEVSTFDGEFISDFPVTVERFESGGTFQFTLGDGAAHLQIQVFDGEIRFGERR